MASKLNVEPAELIRHADSYEELATRAKAISPQAATEVQRIADTHGPIGAPVAAGLAAGMAKADAPVTAKAADFQNYSQRFTEHAATYTSQDKEAAARILSSPDDQIVGPHKGPTVRPIDNATTDTPQLPRHDPPPARWNGKPPPGWHPGTGYWALDTEHPADGPKPRPGPPLYQSNPPCVNQRDLTGPPTGVQPAYGDGGSDNPAKQRATGFDMQGTSRVRIVGTEFNGITQMVEVDGHWYQAQWQEYQYQLNTIPVMQGLGKLGGITMPEMSQANVWQPMTVGQLLQRSSVYPEATFYLPDPLNGGNIEFQNGWWKGGFPSTGIPTPPVMTRGN